MEHLEINVFPISFEKHLGFSIIAAVFFLLQFARTKRWYQLVLAAAIPLSLLIYVAPENEKYFYGIGIMEGILLLLALLLNIVQSRKTAKEEAARAAAEEAAKKAVPAVMQDAPELPEPAAEASEQNTEE
ncbi:MAG: hypothetical protein MJ065_08735 [Oscillospiraceae bacterium]|nr:hypothetical protein [Oscillospiraceae bacterium]